MHISPEDYISENLQKMSSGVYSPPTKESWLGQDEAHNQRLTGISLLCQQIEVVRSSNYLSMTQTCQPPEYKSLSSRLFL